MILTSSSIPSWSSYHTLEIFPSWSAVFDLVPSWSWRSLHDLHLILLRSSHLDLLPLTLIPSWSAFLVWSSTQINHGCCWLCAVIHISITIHFNMHGGLAEFFYVIYIPSLKLNRGENVDPIISNIRIRIIWLSLLGIRIRIMRLLSASAWVLWLLNANEVMSVFKLEVLIHASSKYKKALSVAKHIIIQIKSFCYEISISYVIWLPASSIYNWWREKKLFEKIIKIKE